MRIFTELLFQHGYIADVELAQRLAEPSTPLESTEQAVHSTQPSTDAAHHTCVEKRMARRVQRLVRAMTALSPFR